eukprot:scaffold20_cov147-Skeletonema_marinoi.AAC.6
MDLSDAVKCKCKCLQLSEQKAFSFRKRQCVTSSMIIPFKRRSDEEESDEMSSSRQTKEQHKTNSVSNADAERVPIAT